MINVLKEIVRSEHIELVVELIGLITCESALGLMLVVLDHMEVEVHDREQVEVRETVEARETEEEDKTRKQQTLRHVMICG